MQQGLQRFIYGFTRPEDPRTYCAHRTLHDARNVFITKTIKFAQCKSRTQIFWQKLNGSMNGIFYLIPEQRAFR